MQWLLSLVALLPLVAGGCPDSPASVHASCKVMTVFENQCSTVQQEIMKRINGQNEPSDSKKYWRDPHNNGTYTLISSENGLPATWQFKRVTGDGKYTDLINFDFTLLNNVQCSVETCSMSQVFSIGDSGTNFCNIHDLYCDEPGCNPFYKLFYDENVQKCTSSNQDVCTPGAPHATKKA
jgi:hypothetical protein